MRWTKAGTPLLFLAFPCLALRTLAVSFGYTIVTLPFNSLMVRTEVGIYPLPVAMCTSEHFAKPSMYIASESHEAHLALIAPIRDLPLLITHH